MNKFRKSTLLVGAIITITSNSVNATNGPEETQFLSSTTGGVVQGIRFADEDILAFDLTNNEWSLYFDGSAAGLPASSDIDAFAFLADGSIIFSTTAQVNLPGLGQISDADLLRYDQAAQHPPDRLELYLDGSDVGLTTSSEDINGVSVLPNGDLLISTYGRVIVPGVIGLDEDVLQYSPSSTGTDSQGSWSMYFDGSTADLKNPYEKVTAVSVSATGLYLSTVGIFSVPEAKGRSSDVLFCRSTDNGGCSYEVAWQGISYGFGSESIDALSLRANNVVDAAPDAVLTADTISGTIPLTISFDASASSDDNGISSFYWDFGDGTPEITAPAHTSHTYSESGDFTATVVVTDNAGNTDSATQTIVVEKEITPAVETIVVINEFLASNETGLTDENASLQDWIELYNTADTSVNLAGWCLSDDDTDPSQWCFPSTADSIIAAGGHMVVFASKKDRNSGPKFHTNFKLGKSGEFLGLFAPGSTTATNAFDPYPAQLEDISYGLNSLGDLTYFANPTPNGPNTGGPPPSPGTLEFASDALMTTGNDRLIGLAIDNGDQASYSLSVSSDASSWLSAAVGPDEDGVTTDVVRVC